MSLLYFTYIYINSYKPLAMPGMQASNARVFEVIIHGYIFNIAMENGPFIDGLPIKNGDFPWLCEKTDGICINLAICRCKDIPSTGSTSTSSPHESMLRRWCGAPNLRLAYRPTGWTVYSPKTGYIQNH